MAIEKRVRFESRWLPYALIAPQIAITVVFFFLPAGQAVYWSTLVQDAFGVSTQFVGLDNFRDLFADPDYLASFRVTALFSVLVAGLGLAISLVLAVFADRIVRGATLYKTLLIVPYAVAPAIAAILWLFLFNPTLGVVAHWLKGMGIHWDPLLDGRDAFIMVVIAAVWKQISYNFLFFLAGLQSIPKSMIEAAAIDGAGPMRRFWTIVFPMLSPTTFFVLVTTLINCLLAVFYAGLMLLYSVTFGGFVAFGIYLPSLLRDEFRLSAADAGFRAAGFVVLATLARPAGGWLSDRIGGSRVLAGVL